MIKLKISEGNSCPSTKTRIQKRVLAPKTVSVIYAFNTLSLPTLHYSWRVVYVHLNPSSHSPPGPKSRAISVSLTSIRASFPPWRRKWETTPERRFRTQAIPSTFSPGLDLAGLGCFKTRPEARPTLLPDRSLPPQARET